MIFAVCNAVRDDVYTFKPPTTDCAIGYEVLAFAKQSEIYM
jgi:hypothetical protein